MRKGHERWLVSLLLQRMQHETAALFDLDVGGMLGWTEILLSVCKS